MAVIHYGMAKKKNPGKSPKSRSQLPPDRHCGNELTGGSLVQSLHFDKGKHPRGEPAWNAKTATTWARSHGYVAPAVDQHGQQLHVRQFDPGYCEYRTVPFGKNGVSGVVELPIKRAPAHVASAVDLEMLKRNLVASAELSVGDKVLVDGNFLARVVDIRGAWATVEEVGTRRRDEYRLERLSLAK